MFKGDLNDAVKWMRLALRLGEKGQGHVRPNPPVGAVIVKDGIVIGRGYHRKCGASHAEVSAIEDAQSRGTSVEGSEIFVTLEPCSKPGRVGACTAAIASARIKSVVYAVEDPNPKNAGGAKAAFSKHGIACCSLAELKMQATDAQRRRIDSLILSSKRLIAPFAKFVATGVPFVTVKLAMSLDGKICDDFGTARWISSEKSRKATGRLREAVDAIMVGGETVRRDNPSLLSHCRRNDDLVRVVVSKSRNLPSDARIFSDKAPNETFVYSSPKSALRALAKKGICHVLCEGGLSLARSLADGGFVDEWILVTAPIIIGFRPLKNALRLSSASSHLSDDIITRFRR